MITYVLQYIWQLVTFLEGEKEKEMRGIEKGDREGREVDEGGIGSGGGATCGGSAVK